jgi:signal transduction histidine kinase
MSAGCLLWSANLGGWLYYESIRHTKLPDLWSMDICLFLHLIPMLAAIGLRPHRTENEQKFRLGTFDFLLLLVWWTFLYAFAVFPAQYVAVDRSQYDRNFAVLYLVESGVLVMGLGIVASGAVSGWKRLYLNLMACTVVYTAASQAVNLADERGIYYTGSLFDVGLIVAVSWLLATALSAREWPLDTTPPRSVDEWGAITLRLTMLAILSLPVLGLWTFFWDHSPASTRTFRLFTVLAAMLVLGVFLFMRQYFQDQALIRVLENSRVSFETERRLQSHLVQREKLTSLGELVAGAAHEIDHPLTAIMDYSEKLWSLERLTTEQDALVRKIVHHSQRTRELVTNLLSFAQQRSGEKKMVDLCMLLQRSVQMRELQHHDQKIHIELALGPDLPQVCGDGHQLFQVFVQIVENALDALEEAGGGVLRVSAQLESGEMVVQFSDNGPGIKDPHRVFDPFYTTKPIGKGTGLGLSAVYGVVQDHQGQITCQNNPQGGALFTLRLPVANPSQALAAAAQS